MKNSTVTTEFEFGVVIAPNKYIECWEKEYKVNKYFFNSVNKDHM